jgi:hypothetical protein
MSASSACVATPRFQARLSDTLSSVPLLLCRYWTVDHLAQAIVKLTDQVIIIQKWTRRFLARNVLRSLKVKAKEDNTMACAFLSTILKGSTRFLSKLEQVCGEDDARPSLANAAAGVPSPSALRVPGGGGISRAAKSRKVAMKSVKKSFRPKGSLPEVGSKAYIKKSVKLAQMSRKWFDKIESKRVQQAAIEHDEGYPPMWFHDQ